MATQQSVTQKGPLHARFRTEAGFIFAMFLFL